MRILFHAPASSCYRPRPPLPFLSGIPIQNQDTLSGLRGNHNITSNRGNLFHAEAPPRMIQADPGRSALGNLSSIHQAFPMDVGEKLSSTFDLVILSMANFISANRDMTPFAKALRAISGHIPFVVLGAGLQGKHALESMHPSVQEVLSIFHEKSLLFGVRGKATEQWLHNNGFTKAKALGCPSMFAFPRALDGIEAPSSKAIKDGASYLTAGYLTVSGGHNFQRGVALAQAFEGTKASYVFQDEFFEYGDITTHRGIYDPALSTCDSSALNTLLSKETGKQVDFVRYYYFSETSAWRQVASAHDVYCGDRFHGGVAALQAGKPALFMAHDNRVREMCDFFALPRMTTDELASEGPARAVSQRITPGRITDMRRMYLRRIEDYTAALATVGMTLRH